MRGMDFALGRMRIKKITVEKLFGNFDHTIELKIDERITILHGPNGVGKTVLLEMLDELFRKAEFSLWPARVFEMMPFRLFRVDLEDGKAIEIHKNSYGKLQIYGAEENQKPFMIDSLDSREREIWWQGFQNSPAIHLLQTDRLRVKTASDHKAVKAYSLELTRQIQNRLAGSLEFSASLDRTLPKRLVERMSRGQDLHWDRGTLRRAQEELEEKRRRLENAGILDREDVDIEIPEATDEKLLGALSLYVDDMREKLRIHDDLLGKIELFRNIINRRFEPTKTLLIHKQKGMVFRAANGNEIPPEALSSGEQHEVVLFYELLFQVKPESLVLIDEPEISLHVVWQQQFLRDIQKIIQLASFDVLIATHSPQIVHDRWDLTVSLEEPEPR